MSGPVVALVCDAVAATGLGHLSRCVALGEALADHGATVRVVGSVDADFAAILDDPAIGLAPCATPLGTAGAIDERVAALAEVGAQMVVTDSYEVGPDDLRTVSHGRRSLAIDDFARLDAYPCDLVVNFTVGAPGLSYPSGPRLLLGARWLLVRRSLRRLRADLPAVDRSAPLRRVLVAIGGADRSGTSAAVTRAVTAVDGRITVDVVVGRHGAVTPDLEDAVAAAGPASSITVAAPSLAPHLAAADAVVSGGGLTKYEAAYLGLPVLVVDQTLDQASETAAFVQAGLARSAGLVGDMSASDLARVVEAFAADHDGRSALSVAGLAALPPDPTGAVAEALLRPG